MPRSYRPAVTPLEDRVTPVLFLGSSPDPSLPGQANGDSHSASFSPDGKSLLFESQASNLVPGDTNGVADIFVKDLTTGAVRLVSTDAAGRPADGNSALPVFSPDGKSVAFESDATNLVPGDTNGARDVFVKTLATGAVTRVSVGTLGGQAAGNSRFAAFSPDGQSVAFASDAPDLLPGTPAAARGVYVKSLTTGLLVLESTTAFGVPADAYSSQPTFTPDGKTLAFVSVAGNLTAGATFGEEDLYFKNLTTQGVTRVPLANSSIVTESPLRSDGSVQHDEITYALSPALIRK